MIALALGLIVGLGTALVLGKLEGRSYELTMALNVPLLTYLIADGLYGDWKGIGNVFFSTPLGDFTPSEMIGIQTFLAVLIVAAHLGLRGRNSLTVDEFSRRFSNVLGGFWNRNISRIERTSRAGITGSGALPGPCPALRKEPAGLVKR